MMALPTSSPASVATNTPAVATNTPTPPATATGTPTSPAASAPTDTPSAGATATSPNGAASGGGADTAAYPRIASLYAFKDSSQSATFARYGLVVAPLSAAAAGGVAALKARHTGTHILAYLDSRSVPLPDFGGLTIYPGWWLTLAGTTLTAPIDSATTTIPVADAGRIAGTLATNPDVVVDGESMRVTAVDAAAGTLTVQRGYLSAAAPHAAGTRIAAHATNWPGAWMLNVSPACPVDPASGQTWSDYLAAYAARALAAAPWDGIFYDDADNSISTLSGGAVDANNDNTPDGGDAPSGTGWADGERALFEHTRALAPGAMVVGNGATYAGADNGREFELFNHDPAAWAGSLTAYLQAGTSSIVNPDTRDTGAQDRRAMRFGLGTALLGDGYYSYDYGATAHGQTWWYDEYDGGAGSSLAAGVDAGATTLTVAPGTGGRFQVGDVVRVPSDTYTGAGLSLDDERVRVLGVTGDTLTVRRGVEGSLPAPHATGDKVATDAQLAGGQGWLGTPTGPARARDLTTPNTLANGDFQGAAGAGTGATPLDPWTLCACDGAAAATVSQDGGSARTGAASARIDVTRATPAMPWNVEFYQAGLDVVAGTTYTLSFWARASADRAINAVIQQTSGNWAVRAGQDVTLDTSWRHYTLTFTPSATESGLRVQFNLAQAVGSVWLGGVRFQQGDPNVWERDFTHGAVLVNGTDSPQTVDIGPGYRRIAGTQDPTVNNGAVATSVTLAPRDAIVLTKTS